LKRTPLSRAQTISDKVLAIFPGALGDFICFLPALAKLASDNALDLLARTEYADLAPATVQVRSLERSEISRLFVVGAEDDERLKSFFSAYRYVYSWMGSREPDFVKRLQALSQGQLRVFPFWPFRSAMHISDYYLSCVEAKCSRKIMPFIPLHPGAVYWTREFWRQNELGGKRILALAPGSGAKEKDWPVQFYRAVAEWWETKLGGEVLVVLGPAEEDRKEDRAWGHARVMRGLDLGELAALLAQCHLYIGNDSGVTHLAAALRVETIALFGPTDPSEWAPRGERVTVIRRKVSCSPCADSVRRLCSRRECLIGLSPSDVLIGIEEVLKMASRRPEGASLLDKGGCSD
jgi:ADP-heptose:LPS heptosyltransferase